MIFRVGYGLFLAPIGRRDGELNRQKCYLMYAAVKYMQRRVFSTLGNRLHNRLDGGQ